MKQILLSAGSAALAAALLCSCVPFQIASKVLDESNQVIGQDLEDIADSIQASQEVQISGLTRRTYTASQNITGLDVESQDAAIRIETADVSQVEVEYVEPSDQTLYRFWVEGSTLKIEKRGQSNGNRSEVETSMKITLPAGAYQEIEIRGTNSGVKIQDVEVQSLELENSNSSVSLSGLTVGELSGEVKNGGVKVSDTSAQKIELELSNGSIAFDNAQADDYECEVSNGTISGTLAGREEDYNIRTSVGMGSNNLPSSTKTGAGKSIEFHVDNGSIKVQFAG